MKSPVKMISLSLLLTVGIMFTGCKKDEITNNDELEGFYFGESAQLGQGTVKTYVQMDVLGAPVEMGIMVPEVVMNSLGHDTPAYFSLDLPVKARNVTAYQHMLFDWMPHGHEPEGVFTVPHFDLHFYYTSEAERMQIQATDTVQFMKPVTEGYIPNQYINIGGVPEMGSHWINPTDPVFNGAPFTEVFMYGSYDGEVTFIEPMITKAFILENPNFERNMLQPGLYPVSGKYYPTVYGVKYVPERKEYRFYLSGFGEN
ncbi:MAG: hypothetical protein R2824_35460 [Saprospiraceae bacterium]|nr:hypothetical protein [Lewinella sp.]